MSCREFEGALDAMLHGALDPVARARCVAHAASCAACRELVEPLGATLESIAVEPPASFLPSILARTSLAVRRNPWAETWRQWMLRPRFASEAAYLGVVVLSLAAGTLDRSRVAAQATRAHVVLNDLRSEAGILLDRATSLLEKEKP